MSGSEILKLVWSVFAVAAGSLLLFRPYLVYRLSKKNLRAYPLSDKTRRPPVPSSHLITFYRVLGLMFLVFGLVIGTATVVGLLSAR
jgi:hypothetical protein